ncbi:MAG: valine--tRNA ligase [Planctomycetota bacterium]|nr:valine--tRNA ligase [Planctomycetota bacterium]
MSSAMEMPFDPKSFEKQVAEKWKASKAFHADPSQSGDPYTIVIPPPNVTAALHLGHALNNTLQDILIRWARMRGCNTLWMPGTDHAGIATQTVVEKRILKEEGKRRTDFERDVFVARVQNWKDEYEERILKQLKAMGSSCDWERTRFTMDDMCARAVREIFFKLFNDGLIYRGHRLVNWDPVTQTVLADDEVEHENIDSNFWYFRYPLEEAVEIDGETISYIVVGTTRPETMLGDTAVAMNPKDPRAGALVGKNIVLPIVGRKIPIVADLHVVLPDPESEDEKARFSSGFLKVTPAHDTNDWDIGLRHDLEVINVMAPDASISADFGFDDAKGSEAEAFLGLDRFVAREKIVKWFEDHGLLDNIRPYSHEVGHSYRSHAPIEPYLSRQWYVAVKKPIEGLAEKYGTAMIDGTNVPANSLAGIALEPVLDARLKFVPERYTKTYTNWLENLRDWPISRQLWWGHRIPIWNKEGSHELSQDGLKSFNIEEDGVMQSYACVESDNPELEEKLANEGWTRDSDVLDTWFSSALWPFSTLGWPEKTPELERYYPGNVLCTAREIITLWVSRMVMMGQYVLGDIPFTDVFIHAMIQDGDGRKMSKSLGNGIDPLDIIDSHGSDALRYTLCAMTTQTQDARMPIAEMTLPDGRQCNTSPKFDSGRKLCIKLWNAARFVLQKIEGAPAWADIDPQAHLSDRWILSKLSECIQKSDAAIRAYKFSDLCDTLYHFLYDDFCDWYVEIAKSRIQNGEDAPKAVLAHVLDQFLRLFHPVAPFITEVLWEELRNAAPVRGPSSAGADGLLVKAAYPEQADDFCDVANKNFAIMQDLVREIRNARKTNNAPPRKPLNVTIEMGEDAQEWFQANQDILVSQAALGEVQYSQSAVEQSSDMGVVVVSGIKLYVHDLVDKAAEVKRLNKKKDSLVKGIRGCEGKLKNERFTSSAPAAVVERERNRLAEMKAELETVETALTALA